MSGEGDSSRCLACKSHGLSLGGCQLSVSASGMSVCLGTKRKCLGIWAGMGQGPGPSHEPCTFEKIRVGVCLGKWYLLGLLGDVKERGEQFSLLSEELRGPVDL